MIYSISKHILSVAATFHFPHKLVIQGLKFTFASGMFTATNSYKQRHVQSRYVHTFNFQILNFMQLFEKVTSSDEFLGSALVGCTEMILLD